MEATEDASRDLTPGSDEKRRKQLHGKVRRFGIVIGIDAYQDESIPNLTGCCNDVASMYKLMTDPNCGVFDPNNITRMENPTRNEIHRAFRAIKKKMTENDEFWFYYAGHGWLDSEGNRDGYILPSDAATEDGDLQTGTAISSNELHRELIKRLPCRKVVLFMDCCHAGALGRPATRGFDEECERRELQEALSCVEDGYFCFQATSKNQKAREGKDVYGEIHGVYTMHLLKGLRGGDSGRNIANEKAIVTVSALNDYLSRKGLKVPTEISGAVDYPLSYSPDALLERERENEDQKKIQEWIKQFSADESELYRWLKKLSRGILSRRNNNDEQLSSQETIVVTLLRRYALTDFASDQTAKEEFIRIADSLRELENQTEDQEEENKSNKKLQKEIEKLKKEKEGLEKKIQELENNPQPSPATQFGRVRRTEELRMLAWVLCCINEHGEGKLPWDHVAYWGKISDQEILKECCALVGKLIGERAGEHIFPEWARSGWQNHVNGGSCTKIEEIVYAQIVADIQAE